MENSNEYTSKSPSIFFMEWLAIVAPIVACFVFLFGEIKDQRQRTDDLYKTVISILQDRK